MKVKYSIIIANHNDREMCDRLLKTLLDIDLVGYDDWEIIVVDDGSDRPYVFPDEYAENRRLIRLRRIINLGVGDAFDYGVSMASGEYIILMGADTYVGKNGWIRDAINNYIGGIVCFANKGDNPNIPDKHGLIRSGASIVWRMDGEDLSEKHPYHGNVMYRDIIQAKWLPSGGEYFFKVPCILGAVYLTTRSLYNSVKGFEGHRVWGGLEPMISLKYWLMGSSCWVNKSIVTSHTYTRTTKRPDLHHYYANKMFIAQTLLSPELSVKLLSFYANITVRQDVLKQSYAYLYHNRDLINYLGQNIIHDVRDLEILNWTDE